MWKRSASVLLGTIFAALFVLPLATASAAPQALGLAATPEPMPLHCEDGLCTAFLTAFCLQENRPQPEDGIAYLPTETSVITLFVSTKDGRTLTLPGRDYVEFYARNHTAVIAKLEQRKLDELNAESVAIQIGALTSLIPEEQPGDLFPQSAEELAFATGPYRAAAEQYFDKGFHAERTAITAMLINNLPKRGNVEVANGESAWTDVLDKRGIIGFSEAGKELARATFENCKEITGRSMKSLSFRSCLEIRHGRLQSTTNREYWKSLLLF